jgi:DNA primase
VGIANDDVAQVRASSDFVAIASEHMALRKVGARWVGLCPFHSEKTPSFSINPELGLYYCFGCGAKGDVITFVRETEHLDFVEAVEKLAARAGITLRHDDDSTGRDQKRRAAIHDTLAKAIEWYHQRLLSSRDAARARAYLRSERGYDGEVVRRYRLGWAPSGWDELLRHLDVSPRALLDAGLVSVDERGRHRDFFRSRLLFPIFEPGGQPVGVGGRILPGGQGPKYKNTPATAVYDKSRVLYGLNWAKKAVVERGQAVVCEGYTDAIGLHLAGVGEAVATCGTALADGHIRLLSNFARRVVLAYDADAAGQAAAERYYEWERRFGLDIRVAELPPGTDPADLARREPAALAKSVRSARPFLSFRLSRLFNRADLVTAEGRARAAAEAMSLVAEHPDQLVRDQYVMEVAERCRVDPMHLREMKIHRPHDPATARTSGGTSTALRADAPPRVVVSGPEREALRLAIQRQAEVTGRLNPVLFSHPVARSALLALESTGNLHDAIDVADPQAAELLQRLGVEEATADVDDVVARLVQRSGEQCLRDLQARLRAAPPEEQARQAQDLAWLKRGLEALRTDDEGDRAAALATEQALVGWLAARKELARQTEDS